MTNGEGMNSCHAVSRPVIDSLAESDQNTLNVDIHSFHARRSALKG